MQSFLATAGGRFLGGSPDWYKKTILACLVLNPLLLAVAGPFITGWVILAQFIFTLALALKCYPLQAGGLLALEVVFMGMTGPGAVFREIQANLEVILLLVFMVAGIYFMKPLLMFIFSRVFIRIRSKPLLSLLFCFLSAVLSAFLDALTVMAVLISVFAGFYGVYHRIHSGSSDYDRSGVSDREELGEDLEQFRKFMRSLVMHGAVGTALGGVCTLVGEPQNLLIASKMGWEFMEFFWQMAPITMPVLLCGLVTCYLLEKLKWFGFGVELPEHARAILEQYSREEDEKRSAAERYDIRVQAAAAVFLVIALAFHLAPVGLIGLAIIVLQTAFTGITEEHQIGRAFEEALPFTGLLVVFFVIVAMIHDAHLFAPIIENALAQPVPAQPALFFIANGILSMMSDNVFVATVYINEIKQVFDSGAISRAHFDNLAIAINVGTNLPSVATPNGQAAFLFLLTSSLAPLIRLSYGTMVWMALPYTAVLGGVGLVCVVWFL
ncbi:MAG: Na(+):H(+) antiporter NhaB [Arenicellales bacterium IbO2]|nr:sodium/proton antiporter NhaB [Gammaproteobacteria bacterium]MDA7961770.1 sodium/proton antiporter NhaB [Gammaproteobacteria bacterium]MDA7995402.1 sodium/proton antiporter NhaB [Gammaproteobacteria bacterium]MDA8023841.1 sodium/proton antiporter NhaB [Gammaproteobacteria bacterium]CAJ2376747.1 MAG: Na(+):H(+) antiporter NhaB [Arenicellales bacterium IbO2]